MVFEMHQTKQSPQVIINSEKGYILIKGNLTVEIDVVAPKIYDALADYLKNPAPYTLMEVYLGQYPQSRRGLFIDWFKLIGKHFKDNPNAFLCRWFTEEEDTDNRDDGEDFALFSGLKFEFIEYPYQKEE